MSEKIREKEEDINYLKELYSKNGLYYYTDKEEHINTITHALGPIISFALLIIMLFFSNSTIEYLVSILCCVSIGVEYCISAIYHGVQEIKLKRKWRTIDYPAVNLNILACGTSFSLLYGSLYGYISYAIIISITIIMFILCHKNFEKYRKLSVISSLIIGLILFICFIVVYKTASIKNQETVKWIYLSGLILSISGAILFRIKKKYIHGLFHIIVLLGSIMCIVGSLLQII